MSYTNYYRRNRAASFLARVACALAMCGGGSAWSEIAEESVVDIAAAASQSALNGILTPAQASETLENAINKGQCKDMLLRYVGISPEITAQVTPAAIEWRVSKFEGFSQPPVRWNPEGARIRSFKSPWSAISGIRVSVKTERQFGPSLQYLAIEFSRSGNKGGEDSSMLPLDMKPAGYSLADIMLAINVLLGRTTPEAMTPPSPSSAAAATNAPPPPDDDQGMEPRLQKLKKLYDSGLIEPDVYREKQKEILDGL